MPGERLTPTDHSILWAMPAGTLVIQTRSMLVCKPFANQLDAARWHRAGQDAMKGPPIDLQSLFGFPNVIRYSLVTLQLHQQSSPKTGGVGYNPFNTPSPRHSNPCGGRVRG